MSANPIITVKNLHKKFDKLEVLQGVNLTVDRGDVIAIIGPSGCGKSTFLRCLNLLETPSAGEISFGGEYLFKNNRVYLKRQMKALKADKENFNQEEYDKVKAEYDALRLTEKKIDRDTAKNINHHREKIGMVFQQFNLFPHLTVLKNITLAPVKLKKMTEEEANAKAMDLL